MPGAILVFDEAYMSGTYTNPNGGDGHNSISVPLRALIYGVSYQVRTWVEALVIDPEMPNNPNEEGKTNKTFVGSFDAVLDWPNPFGSDSLYTSISLIAVNNKYEVRTTINPSF